MKPIAVLMPSTAKMTSASRNPPVVTEIAIDTPSKITGGLMSCSNTICSAERGGVTASSLGP